jgi:drug/metabolite transporter (DMT)-like permease
VAFARSALASTLLVPIALRRGALGPLRDRPGAVLVLAVTQLAGPSLLIAWAEQRISSALAGILVAAAPLFVVLLAVVVDQAERASGLRLVGVVIGFAGVGALLGVDTGGDGVLLGGALVLLSAFGYAVSALLLKHRFADVQPIGALAGAMALSALLLLPAAVAAPPTEGPSAEALIATLLLCFGGSGLAFLLFYTLNAEVGPARASIIAYLGPGFAVTYGAVLLDEPIGPWTIAGLALILIGSYLASGGRPSRLLGRRAAGP